MGENFKNIIIISLDSLRSDAIAANSDRSLLNKYDLKTSLRTPILDSFIENGMFFKNCISVAPYTTSAHASILTGFWPYNHGILDFFRNKLKKPTIFQILKNRGFSTLFQTDYPFLLGRPLGFDRGIDKFVADEEKTSLAWIRKNRNKRLACFFHFTNLHSPYGFCDQPSERRDYKSKVESLLRQYKVQPDRDSFGGQHYITGENSRGGKILKQNYLKVLDKMAQAGLYSEIMDLYIEGVNYFEKNRFFSFINNLKKLNLLDDSLFVIAGDHGEGWDKNNQGHYKGNFKDGLIDDVIKVPLIFFGPDIPRGIVFNSQIRTIDIAPTVLSFLGIKGKFDFDGVDLSSRKELLKDLLAFSQLWMTESSLVTIFMNKVKKQKKLSSPNFSSFLLGACVRSNEGKFIQEYSKGGKAVKSHFLSFMESSSGEKKTEAKLMEKLADYNRKTGKKIISREKMSTVKQIRSQLIALGYKI